MNRFRTEKLNSGTFKIFVHGRSLYCSHCCIKVSHSSVARTFSDFRCSSSNKWVVTISFSFPIFSPLASAYFHVSFFWKFMLRMFELSNFTLTFAPAKYPHIAVQRYWLWGTWTRSFLWRDFPGDTERWICKPCCGRRKIYNLPAENENGACLPLAVSDGRTWRIARFQRFSLRISHFEISGILFVPAYLKSRLIFIIESVIAKICNSKRLSCNIKAFSKIHNEINSLQN